MQYDVIVIGGGLSGIGAAIRLSHCGKRVVLCERNSRLGGMNTWYERGGVLLDTGLHALTNYVPETEFKAPFNQVLRQLRIRRNSLNLFPQRQSRILFPDAELTLNNNFQDFTAQVERLFPQDAQGFQAFVQEVLQIGYAGKESSGKSANQILEEHITSERLRDMLRFPVMYYGCPTEEDMDFGAFSTMFRSVIMEGFARPAGGMKPFLETLQQKMLENGAELRTGAIVEEIRYDGTAPTGVLLRSGEFLEAPRVISTIGARETAQLCKTIHPEMPLPDAGKIAFLEAIFALPKTPAEYGLQDAVLFANRTTRFRFAAPAAGVPPASMLVCAPGNYLGTEGQEAKLLRLSTIVDAQEWFRLPREEYQTKKEHIVEELRKFLAEIDPQMAKDLTLLDAFTPKTVQAWTGHQNGAIYGAQHKAPTGNIGLPGITLAGTDQGLLGIVGAMLSGILAANANI